MYDVFVSIYQRIEGEEPSEVPWQSARSRAQWYSRVQIYFCNTWRKELLLEACDLSGVNEVGTDSGQVRQQVRAGNDDEEVCSMTKIRCRICELLGEDQGLNHGLSHPCHLTNLNHLRPGLNYSPGLPNMNYLNHGLLNGLYLPQLKDMMLAAYLLRGKDQRQDICRAQRETRDFYSVRTVLIYSVRRILSTNEKYGGCIIICGICSKEDTW